MVAIGLGTFLLHLLTSGAYGYQRDELYFISCARHLAWGYVDQPPLIAVIARFAMLVLGDSLPALRLLPAAAATTLVVLCGLLTRRLGGGVLAQVLAMLALALAPFYLAVGNLLTMNAFEPLLWLAATLLVLRVQNEPRLATWILLGVVVGLGFLNKYTMGFFVASACAGMLLTSARRLFLHAGFWLAAALALALVAPSLIWQNAHQWPQLEVLRNAASDKNVVVGPLAFYAQQILMMNPLAAPLWIAGLWYLLRPGAPQELRWYGYAYVVLSIVYLCLGAKVYYLAPIYPALLAAGAVPVEAALRRAGSWAGTTYAVALATLGLVIAPQAFPLLPLNAFLAYERVFDVRGIKMERHPQGLVPQNFADMLGWDELVQTLATTYERTDRGNPDVAIFTKDYGQASAVDFLGPRYGLPQAISGHNNYYLLGTRGYSGDTVLAVGLDPALLRSEWRSVRLVATYHDAYVLPDFNNLPIYRCTQPIEPLAAWWPHAKRYI